MDQAAAVPGNSLMIGDNYEADIEGALNVGMRSICFNYHKTDLPPAIHKIDFLSEISRYL